MRQRMGTWQLLREGRGVVKGFGRRRCAGGGARARRKRRVFVRRGVGLGVVRPVFHAVMPLVILVVVALLALRRRADVRLGGERSNEERTEEQSRSESAHGWAAYPFWHCRAALPARDGVRAEPTFKR